MECFLAMSLVYFSMESLCLEPFIFEVCQEILSLSLSLFIVRVEIKGVKGTLPIEV